MKKYFTTLVCLCIAIAINAQSAEKAKSILDEVTKKTKAYPSIVADFSLAMENLQEGISEVYDGSIILKGNKYKVSVMDVVKYFDGTTLYEHMLDAEEVNMTEPLPDDEENLNPATIFTIYQEGYKFNYVGDGTADGKACHEIDLFPENRDKPFSRIKLIIFKDNLQLYSMRQVGKDGNSYTVTIKQMTTNKTVDDNTFVFDQASNPSVDVIDMR
ncbi:LolA family protein [Carboxylicivirga sp. N1Y90]|uniref:LolA family protein n=1 Tax=Carboxylicivirga fragile TaxID=3417571 RepID=UPI003D3394CD|nr:outer membrane lipoprotein carrier protein LolA [Marinilabiliaceae bacterium N1Y90]